MPQSIVESFKINNAISQYDLYNHALAKVSCSRGHEINNFGRPFLIQHNFIHILSVVCLERRKFLKK